MGRNPIVAGLAVVAGATLCACGGETRAAGTLVKGGDDRTGAYDVVPGWLKPAPDHGEAWSWGLPAASRLGPQRHAARRKPVRRLSNAQWSRAKRSLNASSHS